MINVIIVGFIVVFHKYLKKPSRYLTTKICFEVKSEDGKKELMKNSQYPIGKYRSYFDILVITSLIYGMTGFYAYSLNEKYLSLFCLITCVSSSLYHLYGEQMYFNFDNILATTLLNIYFWSFILSAWYRTGIFCYNIMCGIFGIPLAICLLVGCGMPGELKIMKDSLLCCRCEPNRYKPIHSIWHLVSGVGLFIAAQTFFSIQKLSEQLDCPSYMFHGEIELGSKCYFDSSLQYPVVPTITFIISIAINIIGNEIGLMPVD